MGRSVRISEEAALHFARAARLGCSPDLWARQLLDGALARLDRIPKSKRFRTTTSCPSRKPSKEEKRDRRADIREKVFKRAEVDGLPQCEGPAGSNPRNGGRCVNPPTDLQHVFGRGKGRMPESERNCLAACRACHEAEGRNDPSGWDWWKWFADFFQQRGFVREAAAARKRAFFESRRAALPAAPRAVKHD